MNATRRFPMRVAVGIVLVVAAACLAYVLLRHGLNLDALQHARDALLARKTVHPLGFAAAFFGAYVLVAIATVPGAEIMTMAAGALFGLVEATLLVPLASTLGATLAMLISRFLFRDFVQRHAGKRLQWFDRGMARDGA